MIKSLIWLLGPVELYVSSEAVLEDHNWQFNPLPVSKHIFNLQVTPQCFPPPQNISFYATNKVAKVDPMGLCNPTTEKGTIVW